MESLQLPPEPATGTESELPHGFRQIHGLVSNARPLQGHAVAPGVTAGLEQVQPTRELEKRSGVAHASHRISQHHREVFAVQLKYHDRLLTPLDFGLVEIGKSNREFRRQLFQFRSPMRWRHPQPAQLVAVLQIAKLNPPGPGVAVGLHEGAAPRVVVSQTPRLRGQSPLLIRRCEPVPRFEPFGVDLRQQPQAKQLRIAMPRFNHQDRLGQIVGFQFPGGLRRPIRRGRTTVSPRSRVTPASWRVPAPLEPPRGWMPPDR